MQFFELHFNPPKKEDLILDSFCFEPENIYEKRLGSLFIIGQLKNVLPQNLKFLDNLSNFLKQQFYSAPMKFSPEGSLKESLKKTNEFLEQIVKKDNVSWLGNLNLAILNLVEGAGGRYEINFTKSGEIEILLIRNSQIIDIGKNLEFSEIEPYPLKIFSNIVSGKLIENDIILVLTKEVFSAFSSENLLEKIAQFVPFEEKKFREILKEEEKKFLKISGICLLCHLKEIPFQAKKLIQPIIFHQKLEGFKISQAFLPALRLIKKIRFFKIPKLSFPKFAPNNLILILILMLFLVTGFFIFKGEKTKELKLAQEIINQVQSKKIEAESFLILKKEKEANLLFQEAYKKILPQTEKEAPLKEEALLLKKEIEEKLLSLNKLELIEEPDLFFEFTPKETEILIPQEMLLWESNLYFFNPFASNVYVLNLINKSGNFLDVKRNLKSGAISDDLILFFSNSNILLSLKNDEFKEKILQSPSADFQFNKFAVFKSGSYFLDTKSGEIVKYPPPNFEKNTPLIGKLWLNKKSSKFPVGGKSITIDGSIWILTKNNEIDRYYGGFYKETLKLSLFPYFENPTKIWTRETRGTNSYLYLLEPEQKRIVILTKKGEIVKQYQSEKFDNLLDFAVSEDGKTIWLLNGVKVYKLTF